MLSWKLSEEVGVKTWSKACVREQGTGLEATSYIPTEIDII